MTERSEALTQLSRILGDESLRSASPDAASAALASRTVLLIDGLVAEAAQSDDVFDRDSGLAYVERRLESLSGVIGADLREQVLEAAREQIEKW
ncbi:MAG: hypothetical protein AB7P33_19320 [Dehalococcoidia bacterium]